jgi:hypothetical protein
MKFLDAFIGKVIYLLVIGMSLFLVTSVLAITHLGGIFDCPICN